MKLFQLGSWFGRANAGQSEADKQEQSDAENHALEFSFRSGNEFADLLVQI